MVLVILNQSVKLNPRNNGGINPVDDNEKYHTRSQAGPRAYELTRIGAKHKLQIKRRKQEGRKDTIGIWARQ